MAENPRLAKPLAQFHASRGNTEGAIDIYRRLPAGPDMACTVDRGRGFRPHLGTDAGHDRILHTRAVEASGADGTVKAQALAWLCEANAHDKAIELLRVAPGYDGDLDARRPHRAHYSSTWDATPELIGENARHCSAPMSRSAHMPEGQLARARRNPSPVPPLGVARARVAENRFASRGAAANAATARPSRTGLLGMLASAQLDFPAAGRSFRDSARAGPPAAEPQNMIRPRRSRLLHERLHHFGEAYAAMRRMSESGLPGNEYASLQNCAQGRRLLRLEATDAFSPNASSTSSSKRSLRVRIGYEPRPKHLLTVSSSLRPGGSERQTVDGDRQNGPRSAAWSGIVSSHPVGRPRGPARRFCAPHAKCRSRSSISARELEP